MRIERVFITRQNRLHHLVNNRQKSKLIFRPRGNPPLTTRAEWCYLTGMNMLLLIVVLLLLFGGGGFYFGGPAIGGGGLGLALLICLIVFFMGGFRTSRR